MPRLQPPSPTWETHLNTPRRVTAAALLALLGAAPAFRKIAELCKGSAGTGGPHWNKATMPDPSERPLVSDAEARRLAAWILKL